MEPLWLLGLLFAALCVRGMFRRRSVRTQKMALESTAATLGFDFKETTDLYTENSEIPSRYWTWNVRNCMTGVKAEAKISIFNLVTETPQDAFETNPDGSFDHSSEENRERRSPVGILLTGLPRSIPFFTLSPESFLTRERGPGKLDINFENHPEFSKSYTLQADHTESVRALFDHDVLTFFTRARVSLTACEGSLYLIGGPLKSPKEIMDFLALALTSRAVLAQSAARNLADVGAEADEADELLAPSKPLLSSERRAALETIAKEARPQPFDSEVERRISERGFRLLTIPVVLLFWGIAAYVWFDIGWRDGAFLIVFMGLAGTLFPIVLGWQDENSLISRLLAHTSLGRSKMDPDAYEPWRNVED